MALAPSGELTTIMVGKETTFGTAATPTVTLIADDIQMSSTNVFLERPGARGGVGRTKPATGMFMGKGTFNIEADPDNIGAILSLAYGLEGIASTTHTFTFASPRKSFTTQVNRITDAINYVGCKVSDLSFNVTEKSILNAKVGVEYVSEAFVASPVTPTYSTLYPFVFQTVGNTMTIAGSANDATIMDFGFTINNGLITDFPSFGNGRYRAQLPETLTKVSGTMSLAFETETMYKKFWGGPSATGPQSTVPGVSLVAVLNSQDGYSLTFNSQNVMITDPGVMIKAADYVKQSMKFECYSATGPAAGDDLKIILTNASTVASI